MIIIGENVWVWAAADLEFVQKLFAGCVSSDQNIDSLARPYFNHSISLMFRS
jgi:hypothetical protein